MALSLVRTMVHVQYIDAGSNFSSGLGLNF